MKIEQEIFKKLDIVDIKKIYDTGTNKFWFIEVDIIDYHLSKYDDDIKNYFYDNLIFYQGKTILFEIKLLTNYLNFLFKRSCDDSFISFYNNYMEEFLANPEVKISFFEQFNELFRSLNKFYENQISYIVLIVNEINKNKNKIESVFNIKNLFLKSIRVGNGDLHENGISTAILELNEKKVLFKSGDNHTESLIMLYNIFLLQSGLSEVKMKSLQCGKFYYEEFLETNKISDIENLMKSTGILLFLTYLLGLTDLHYDNLVISRDKFVPIDCETIFNVKQSKSDEKYDLGESVYVSFLLPMKRVNNCVLSGISSEEFVFFENKDYILDFTEEALVLSESYNKYLKRTTSFLQGYKLYDYTDLIIDSFEKSYLYFIENSEFIIDQIDKMIQGKNQRILMRNTSEYVSALMKSYEPYLMVKTDERINFFRNKNNFTEIEIKSMMDNVIPTFFNDITLDKTYYDKFTKDDILREINFIKASINFEMFENIDNKPYEDNYSEEKDYYNYLSSELVNVENDLFWIDIINYKLDDKEVTEIIRIPDTIYAGKSGISLFLLEYLHKNQLLPDERIIHRIIQELYSSFLDIVKDENSSCGIYDGTAGMFYLLYKYHKYTGILDENSLFSQLKIMIENINNDEQLDIISGQAGLLKLLTYLWNEGYKDLFILKGIESIQDNLISEIKNLDLFIENRKYIGYSHGLVGIVASLAESSIINYKDSISEIIERSTNYLISVLDEEKGIPSTNDCSKYYNSWCHGNSGYLLGLYNIYKSYNSDIILDIIKKLLKILLKESASDFKLCHGNLGNYLISYNVSLQLNEYRYQKLFESKLNNLIKKISPEHFKYYNKNIMVGLSGFYYWKLLDWDMEGKLDLI